MEVTFIKLTDARHAVAIVRDDGSTERTELDSRSFLNHDFAHVAIEAELRLENGFWGSVAAGAGLAGLGLEGADILLAERLTGPVQSLLRVDAGPAEIQAALEAFAPDLVQHGTGAGIVERFRRLRGQWRATPYRGGLLISWPLDPVDRQDGDTALSASDHPAAHVPPARQTTTRRPHAEPPLPNVREQRRRR